MFELKSISHSFNGNPTQLILDDISFGIQQGECVGLTGPSGCGKSTLAQIGAGFITPTHGKVLVNGRDLTSTPSRNVALIHQEADLFPWLKVEKQVLFAQKIKDRDRAKELISLVSLTGSESLYPSQLSGGMKKRLALARVLAINPKLLILDESFSSLDANLKRDLYADLRRIWRRTKTTILLITHDSKDLQNLAHREIQLSDSQPTRIVHINTHNHQ